MKSVTFDNGQGFALGYDEAAPSPFVIWQFTEPEPSKEPGKTKHNKSHEDR